MLQILAITVPIYLVIGLGYLAVRHGVFVKADMRVLGTFVVKFALPALVFTALTQRPLDEVVDALYLADYLAGSLVVLFVAFLWGRARQGKGTPQSALSGMAMSCSNSGYVGYPIVSQVVGPGPAAVALALCMIVENLVMIPTALLIADTRSEGGERWPRVLGRSFAQLVRQPLIVAIVVALVVQILRVPLFAPLTRTVGILATASTAVSLFVIGGTLPGLEIRGMRRDVLAISLGKLGLHPLAVGLFVWAFPPTNAPLRTAAIAFAAMPMLGIFPILAQKYDYESFAAAALLLTTVLSFLSINAVLWVLTLMPL